MTKIKFAGLLCLLLISCQSGPKPIAGSGSDASFPIAPREQVEAHGKKWVVSTQGKLATQAAAKIMRAGGNLMDAAIAASFAISVERPQSTGIGGGGFLIYYEARKKQAHVIDFRERAPIHANSKMYLDDKGNVIKDKSVSGGAAVGVPGFIRGMSYLHKKWGKLAWSKLVAPAMGYAENGFDVYPSLAVAYKSEAETLREYAPSRAALLKPNGEPYILGEKLVQKDLARTLKTIAHNSEDFYTGKIAKKIVKTANQYGGILSTDDLFTYRVIERQAVRAPFLGYELISMPPPSSGGIHVLQILKMLEHDDLAKWGMFSAQSIHQEAQAMQYAFADRSKYLGDPDFVTVPVKALLNEDYLARRRSGFTAYEAQKAAQIAPGDVTLPHESSETTHLSLMDQEGNVIVTTQSVNGWFGSAVVAEGTGIVLNNTMDDFSAKPGAQNIFGAVGSDANRVESRKRPLSSMSPTIVLKNGKPVLALGAPGGTRIITAVAQVILNSLVFKKDLYESVAAPRIHHQWIPDELWIENQSVPRATINDLEKRGYQVKRVGPKTNIMAVAVSPEGGLVGVSDPRDIGTSAGE